MIALADNLVKLDSLRHERKILESRIDEIQKELLVKMTRDGREEILFNSSIAKIVRPSKEVLDELGLKDDLDPKTWELITRRVYDSRRAEIAIEEGYLEYSTLQKYMHLQNLSPYIKITHR